MSGPDLDFKFKAEQMHRRAQTAEARAERLARKVDFWRALYREVYANRETINRRLKRTRAKLTAARAQLRSPLDRIIELGRRFP